MRSTSTTENPDLAKWQAAAAPAGPAPITATSVGWPFTWLVRLRS
jgi:hypothetical protein